jgi:hypothetical protein
MDVGVYAESLLGEGKELESILKEIEDWKRYDKIFYLPIEFPLVVDEARFGDTEFQEEIDDKLLSALSKNGYYIHTLT